MLVLLVIADAQLEVANCHLVVLLFEMRQAQVVVHLCVVGLELVAPIKSFNSLLIVVKLVQRDAKVEEAERALGLHLFQLLDGQLFDRFPVFTLKRILASLLEVCLSLLKGSLALVSAHGQANGPQ